MGEGLVGNGTTTKLPRFYCGLPSILNKFCMGEGLEVAGNGEWGFYQDFIMVLSRNYKKIVSPRVYQKLGIGEGTGNGATTAFTGSQPVEAFSTLRL